MMKYGVFRDRTSKCQIHTHTKKKESRTPLKLFYAKKRIEKKNTSITFGKWEDFEKCQKCYFVRAIVRQNWKMTHFGAEFQSVQNDVESGCWTMSKLFYAKKGWKKKPTIRKMRRFWKVVKNVWSCPFFIGNKCDLTIELSWGFSFFKTFFFRSKQWTCALGKTRSL